jgi:hypothetical protein
MRMIWKELQSHPQHASRGVLKHCCHNVMLFLGRWRDADAARPAAGSYISPGCRQTTSSLGRVLETFDAFACLTPSAALDPVKV